MGGIEAGKPIPIGDAAVVFLADALSRVRTLNETESRILQRAISRETGAFRRWTLEDDRKLLKMHKAKISAVAIARTLGRSHDAVRCRLRNLKKSARARRQPTQSYT